MKIYRYSGKNTIVVFEGTAAEGRAWVLNQIKPLSDGRRIYRTWGADEDGKFYVDADGPVYWAYENFMNMPK